MKKVFVIQQTGRYWQGQYLHGDYNHFFTEYLSKARLFDTVINAKIIAIEEIVGRAYKIVSITEKELFKARLENK